MPKWLKETIYASLVASQVLFCTISYLPQIWKLIRTKKSEDISIQTWVLLTISFMDYGLILMMDHVRLPLLLMNAFELSLCLATTVLVIWYRKHGRK